MPRLMPVDIDRLLKSDTWRYCCEQHPAYGTFFMNLWAEAYKNRGRLPNDDEELRKLARCKPEWWLKLRGLLLAKWITSPDGKFIMHPVVCEMLSKKPPRQPKKTADYTPDFENWWKIVLECGMAQGSKVEAFEAWKTNNPPRPPLDKLLIATRAYVCDAKARQSKMVHPCRFLSKAYFHAVLEASCAPAADSAAAHTTKEYVSARNGKPFRASDREAEERSNKLRRWREIAAECAGQKRPTIPPEHPEGK